MHGGWLGAGIFLCGVAGMALAQETSPSGLEATFDFSQSLEYSDNPDLEENGRSEFFGRTVLGFGLTSETSIQSFALNFGTDLELGRRDKSSVNTNNSFVRLGYDRETSNAHVGARANYRESDTSSSFFDDFDNDSRVINQDDGTRVTYNLGFTGAVVPRDKQAENAASIRMRARGWCLAGRA